MYTEAENASNWIVHVDGDDISLYMSELEARNDLEAYDIANQNFHFFTADGCRIAVTATEPNDIWRSDIRFNRCEADNESRYEMARLLTNWFETYGDGQIIDPDDIQRGGVEYLSLLMKFRGTRNHDGIVLRMIRYLHGLVCGRSP